MSAKPSAPAGCASSDWLPEVDTHTAQKRCPHNANLHSLWTCKRLSAMTGDHEPNHGVLQRVRVFCNFVRCYEQQLSCCAKHVLLSLCLPSDYWHTFFFAAAVTTCDSICGSRADHLVHGRKYMCIDPPLLRNVCPLIFGINAHDELLCRCLDAGMKITGCRLTVSLCVIRCHLQAFLGVLRCAPSKICCAAYADYGSNSGSDACYYRRPVCTRYYVDYWRNS